MIFWGIDWGKELRALAHEPAGRPSCFKSNPSYQTQAENDCESCKFKNECHDKT